MEMELAIFGQLLIFLFLSFGTLMAATDKQRLRPDVRRSPFGGTSFVPKRGVGSADRRVPWR